MTPYPELGRVEVCEGSPGYRMYGEAIALNALSDEKSIKVRIDELRKRAHESFGYLI